MIFVAIVRKYLPNNVTVDYDDGSFESFDSTQLSIMKPVVANGQILNNDHNNPQPPESPWRKIGAQLRLQVDKDIFAKKPGQSIHFFSAGIKVLAVE